jgi:protein TonB
VVELRAVIAPDGSVWELTVAPGKGHPFLIPTALESVKRWVYQPSTADGQPAEVETTIQVNFRLGR